MDDLNQNLRQSRRNKHGNDERPFSCGCGKAYLSYAALYTHIKYKHDGAPPEGTASIQSSFKRGRGRPRKSVNSELTRNNRIIPYDPTVEDYGFEGTTPDPQSCFLDKTSRLYAKFAQWATESDKSKQFKHTHSCDDAFALFLLDIVNSRSTKGFNSFIEYLGHFRECANTAGRGPAEYTSSNGPWELPKLCNSFIQDYLPLLDRADRAVGIAISLQFCTWLFSQAYTTYKLDLIRYY